jgi:GNAT superfamily N-acetyltransferase
MDHILVYSDSLTWGIVPDTRQRLPFDERWPGVLENKLNGNGRRVRVIEDCLNGRRTVWEDPFKPGRNGLQGLQQRIEINSPLALVILMLGTNDFQFSHPYNNAWSAAQGIAALVNETGHVFALDWSGLQKPEISFYALWEGDEILGVGALKELEPRAGEIKSMRTADAHLRRGVAATILEHIIAEARQRGYTRLSLETGSGPAFEPALELYRKYGFAHGGAFGGYEQSPFNQFLHLDLVSTRTRPGRAITIE